MVAFPRKPAGAFRTPEYSRGQFVPDSSGEEFVTLPTDLRLWFGAPTILAWIAQEMDSLLRGPRASDDSVMLRVLSYAYATQLFSSEEIARQCRGNALFQRLCCGLSPFSEELRSFRRKNRMLLEQVLSSVFMQAILRRFGLVTASVPEELAADLRDHARERLNIARHLDAGDE